MSKLTRREFLELSVAELAIRFSNEDLEYSVIGLLRYNRLFKSDRDFIDRIKLIPDICHHKWSRCLEYINDKLKKEVGLEIIEHLLTAMSPTEIENFNWFYLTHVDYLHLLLSKNIDVLAWENIQPLNRIYELEYAKDDMIKSASVFRYDGKYLIACATMGVDPKTIGLQLYLFEDHLDVVNVLSLSKSAIRGVLYVKDSYNYYRSGGIKLFNTILAEGWFICISEIRCNAIECVEIRNLLIEYGCSYFIFDKISMFARYGRATFGKGLSFASIDDQVEADKKRDPVKYECWRNYLSHGGWLQQ